MPPATRIPVTVAPRLPRAVECGVQRGRCDVRSGAEPGRDQAAHDHRLARVRRLRRTDAAQRTARHRGLRRGQRSHREGGARPQRARAHVVARVTCRGRVGIDRY